MCGRLPASLLLLALMTGSAQAQIRAVLGPTVPVTGAAPVSVDATFLTPVLCGPGLGPPAVDLPAAPSPSSNGTWVDAKVLTPRLSGPGLGPPAVDLPTAPSNSSNRAWVDAEVLLWWMKRANLPPLVTSSPSGSAAANIGALGVPGTAVLFGGSGVNGDLTVGGRLTAGFWLDCDRTCGIEGYYFQLGARPQHFQAGTPDNVGRPFINAATGLPDAELVSLPGFLDGNVRISATSGNLLGAGALARANLCCGCWYRLDALAGYRFLNMSDRVGIVENLTSADPAQTVAPLGTNILVSDNFRTSNQFHGGDIGLAGEMRWHSWSLGANARVALGSTQQQVDIDGATAVIVPGFAPITNSGGLLALSSNSGHHTRNIFAVVPEVRFQLAYQVGPRVRLHAGYTFLYWSNVVRAGDQIDLVVNPALLPPPVPGASPLRPAFQFNGTSFWAQGIDLGLEFRF